MTYSIVARDAETGELGVGVQTCNFAAGTIVPWARAGVGAVATQAMGEVAHGRRIIDAMAEGIAAPAALEASLAVDAASAMRQVGAVDAAGRAAAFTGALCIGEAGHHCGDGYAAQANMMASDNVWPAMADAFERGSGPLADRLLSALDAAQAAGGDARGCMSAALFVVEATPAEDPRGGVILDLRVDAHDAPLGELRRLLDVRNAYQHNASATDALVAGDIETAASEIDAALALLPADENFRFLKAGVLIFSGRVDDGRTLTRALVAERPSWATVIRSFAVKGLLPLPDDLDVESFIRA
jgi:uncharacterized Ntn-hydrolase superfamily protein